MRVIQCVPGAFKLRLREVKRGMIPFRCSETAIPLWSIATAGTCVVEVRE